MIERTIEHRMSLIMDPSDGKIPPMTPDGRARFERTPPPTAAGQKRPPAGPEDLSNALRCITYGMPRVGMQNINAAGPMGYYQILQTPNYVTLTIEAIHETRIIPLDGRPHLPQGVRRPWTVMIRMWRTQDKIYEYACREGNYHTMEGILGAARADEAAAK